MIRGHNAQRLHLTFLGPLGLFVVAAGGLSVSDRRAKPRPRGRREAAACASRSAPRSARSSPSRWRRRRAERPPARPDRPHPPSSSLRRSTGPANVVGNLVLFLPLGADALPAGPDGAAPTVLTGALPLDVDRDHAAVHPRTDDVRRRCARSTRSARSWAIALRRALGAAATRRSS